jgi:hypothetical protein
VRAPTIQGSRLSPGKEIRGGVWPCRCAVGLTAVERKRGGGRDEGGRRKEEGEVW